MTDVLVAGGGPAGIAAAVVSARRGAGTVLIERYGFLGGMATAGLVNPFMEWHTGGEPLVAGVFQEMLDSMAAAGGYGGERQPTAFEPEAFKLVADRLCLQAGVQVRFHTLVTRADVSGSAITAIHTESKSGPEQWTARVYIDCTGDADVAFLAGVPCDEGREADHLTQPMTLNFRMADVDIERMPSREEINSLFDTAKAEGRVTCPRENVLWFHTLKPGVVHFNTTRVTGLSATKADDLTAAEFEARQQAHELARFLVSDVPGFERAYLQQSAAQIGVRESRRIRGRYALTADDVVQARKFPDGIARSNYPIDIHSPTGAGTDIRGVAEGDYYEIPYRCLLPQGIDNLLVAGRCVSSTHEGQAALRIMPTCFAMGEAAGAAAALACRQGISARDVEPESLRQALRDQGQIV
ncbi:MAG: FAD-dependent oxidoreductase [Armatimonadetes bacterium]|nr:FAD-dependent oxidoreductase [Armatimonadota bacterium]